MLSESKQNTFEAANQTLQHRLADFPTQRPSSQETQSYSLLNQGEIKAGKDLSIEAPEVLNRNTVFQDTVLEAGSKIFESEKLNWLFQGAYRQPLGPALG
jgi:hypothetical protein